MTDFTLQHRRPEASEAGYTARSSAASQKLSAFAPQSDTPSSARSLFHPAPFNTPTDVLVGVIERLSRVAERQSRWVDERLGGEGALPDAHEAPPAADDEAAVPAAEAASAGPLWGFVPRVYAPLPTAAQVRAGLPLNQAYGFAERMGLSKARLGPLLDLTTRTLSRLRAEEKPLPRSASDRLAGLLRVEAAALRAFPDAAQAKTWLGRPHKQLENLAPLDYLDTEPGRRYVEALLGALEDTTAT